MTLIRSGAAQARTKALATVALVAAMAACSKPAPPPVYQAVAVATRDIVVSATATGKIQPDTVVEVKSLAGGEVLMVSGETGKLVRQGEMLVRIDPRQPKNAVEQAEANLEVAKTTLSTSETQRQRARDLFKSQSLTQAELETAELNYANARASLVAAKVALENARITLGNTDVRAPITGTIIERTVERGQIVASAVQNVSGGAVLMRMADLSRVQVFTLVDETDIGKIRIGMRATVTVDAYPNRPFEGEVIKIEPTDTTSQNVTMFPVRVRIDNREGLLLPGMNTEVKLHVGQRNGVLAVPNAALRTERDMASAAGVLSLPMETVQKQLADAPLKDAPRAGDSTKTSTLGATAPNGGASNGGKPSGNTMTTSDGRVMKLPDGVTEAQVKAIFAKFRSGDQPTPEERAILAQVRRLNGGMGGGGRRTQDNNYLFGGKYVVFTRKNATITARNIATGLTDLDYSEVKQGLAEGDSVIILPSASMVQSQQELKNRISNMTGGGMPGMRQQGGAQGGGGQGGGGGRPGGN